MKIKTSYLTNFGNHRVKNEDSLLVQYDVIYQSQMFESENRIIQSENSIFCVADGMGGHLGGELASRSVLFYLKDQFSKLKSFRSIRKALNNSKKMLNTIAFETKTFGLGTTISGLLIRKNKAILFNCGDSRIYKLEGNNLIRLTNDHSVVQSMYNKGLIEEEEMRTHPNKNLLTSAIIGDFTSNLPQIYFNSLNIKAGDQFFLCTDGLWESMSKLELESIFFNSEEMSDTAFRLNDFSLTNGGRDNITLILIEILDLN
jgi:PPM family protein phosphatase